MTIIICMIVIALCAMISEFRIMSHEKQKQELREKLSKNERGFKKMSELAEESIDLNDVLYDVLVDELGLHKACELIDKKKKEIREEEL